MAFPCCPLSGYRYINADGELDQDRLNESVEAQCNEGLTSAMEFVVRAQAEHPCKCECHQDGKNVLH